MLFSRLSIAFVSVATSLFFCVAPITTSASVLTNPSTALQPQNAPGEFAALSQPSEPVAAAFTYKWNINDRQSPLLGISEQLPPGFDQTLSYSVEGFDFPIFKALNFDETDGKYLLPAISRESRNVHFIEFVPTGERNVYLSADGTNIQLLDNDNQKTFRTAGGAKFIFVRYPDGEFRCASIKPAGSITINLLYSANGLALHGVVDSMGRSVTFNSGKEGIISITQTWTAQSEGITRSWAVGEPVAAIDNEPIKYAHAVVALALKAVPSNAVVHEYTAEMAASDKLLAQIFGGPNAVAGANGFEPSGLGAQYPLYRGDIIGDDGEPRRGHLSHAMHLYGSPDGRGDSPLYVPAGFTSHSGEPSPTDAAVLFYYPRLGNLTDVTLAVFHVADFQITYEGDRVRIGNLGGLGGSSALYKHSHIEFYRGNTSLPPASARAALRIDPSTIFRKR